MDPRRTAEKTIDEDIQNQGPALEEQDWDAIGGKEIAPDSVPENGDLRYDVDPSGEAPDERDDNPYQESDEALPEDREEAAITRDPSKEGGRFDQV